MTWFAVFFLLSSPLPGGTAEWAFAEAQERFVVESVGATEALRSLGRDQRSLLVAMDSDDFRHREWATKEMSRLGARGTRACFLGTMLCSPEVQMRCLNVLRAQSVCQPCRGQGGFGSDTGYVACAFCDSAGYFWPAEELAAAR
jgi:hypothetical protein